MRSEATLSQAALLVAWSVAAALPGRAQETPEPVPNQIAPDSAAQSAQDRDGITAMRVTTGYPARALRDGLTGTVGVRVTVTPEGRATDCVVTQPSGHPELDRAACKEIQEQARFEPALDDKGEPISAPFSTKVTFRIK